MMECKEDKNNSLVDNAKYLSPNYGDNLAVGEPLVSGTVANILHKSPGSNYLSGTKDISLPSLTDSILSTSCAAPFNYDAAVGTAGMQNNFFSTKLSPIIKQQSVLLDNFIHTDHSIVFEHQATVPEIGNLLAPIGNAVTLINGNLEKVGAFASNVGLYSQKSSYDLVNKPLLSTLNIASDAISTNQMFASTALSNVYHQPRITQSAISHIGRLTTLSDVALDMYQSPVPSIKIEKTDEKIDNVSREVKRLANEIEAIKNKKRENDLSEIKSEIVNHLGKIDKEMEDKFKGAINAIESENEDYVAQSAESLTRLIEMLPYHLGAKVEQGMKKEVQITKGLAKYLNVPEDHYLALQQQSFYAVLGGIRHGNKEIYPIYNKNKPRYKALVMQIEAYIYTLLTYKNDK